MRAFALLGAAWAYRGFIMGSVRREFQAKYGNAMLGAAWTLLQPLAMIVVYTVIFAQVMHSKLPGNASTFAYSIYLCAGILTWGLFAEILARAQTMFLDNASLIKKISFPRICLPIIVVLSALLNFAIIFGLFVVFLVISGTFPGLVFFTILPVLLVQVLFAVGLGLLVGLLNVFFRDVGQLFSIVLQFWFWFTPVVYPTSILPEGIRALLVYNPMAAVIGAYQTVLVDARAPDWPSLLPATVAAVLLCVLGLRMFRRRAGEMVDEL